MRKTVFLFLILCVCTGAFSQQMPVVAVAPFEAISGISAEDASIITRVFFIRLGNTGQVNLVDRTVVERILQEHQFQTGDWSNPQKTAELNEALNADWIVRGELERFRNNILVTVQFYDIRTFRFMGGTDILIENAEDAYDKMDPIVDRLIGTISGSETRQQQTAGTQSGGSITRTYNIGDRGPAGGFIFYDKGIFSNGWRYLEAAPTETEFRAGWGLRGTALSGLGNAVGTGKQNTAIIIGQRGLGHAARLCANLSFDGFNDWFLPSSDELNLMYLNLKRRGLGDFADGAYWSSSQSGNNHAWSQNFRNGNRDTFNKNNTCLVRAIRAF